MNKIIFIAITFLLNWDASAQISMEIDLTNDTSEYQYIRNRIKDNEFFLKLDSNNVGALVRRAQLLFQIQEYSLCITDYNKLIKLLPKMDDPFVNRGFCYLYSGKGKLALIDFEKAIEMKPNDPVNHFNEAYAYSEFENHKAAVKSLNKAIELNSAYAKAYANRGYSERILGNYDIAIKDYNKAIELVSDYTIAYYGRGMVYTEMKKYKEALQDYAEVERLSGSIKVPDIYIEIGKAYLGLNYFDGSDRSFLKALNLTTDEASNWYYKSIISSVKGNNKLAIEQINKAIDISPNEAVLYHERAKFYVNLSENDLAQQDRDKYQKLKYGQK